MIENKKSKKEFREALADVQKGENLVGPFGNIAELRKSLLEE